METIRGRKVRGGSSRIRSQDKRNQRQASKGEGRGEQREYGEAFVMGARVKRVGVRGGMRGG